MTKILELIQAHDFESTLLVGFYGGGNYGDELLLEVMENIFYRAGIKDLTITYRQLNQYSKYHHDFEYKRVDINKRKEFIGSFLKNKNVVIGGGGLWGLDVNLNIFILSFLLFLGRWVFSKKIYLIGVGYYNSTGMLGHMSAFLAAKSATRILARDEETFQNFSKLNKSTTLDSDISWTLKDINLEGDYGRDVATLEKNLPISAAKKTVFITLRRFKADNKNKFNDAVKEFIASNPHLEIIVALMEPYEIDPEGRRLLAEWKRSYKNITTLDFNYNPLALFFYFSHNRKNLIYIGPQFHGIITAYLNGVPFLPVVYDNKVHQILNTIAPNMAKINIKDVKLSDLNDLISSVKDGNKP